MSGFDELENRAFEEMANTPAIPPEPTVAEAGKCPVCCGVGNYLAKQGEYGESIPVHCDECNGTGRIEQSIADGGESE